MLITSIFYRYRIYSTYVESVNINFVFFEYFLKNQLFQAENKGKNSGKSREFASETPVRVYNSISVQRSANSVKRIKKYLARQRNWWVYKRDEKYAPGSKSEKMDSRFRGNDKMGKSQKMFSRQSCAGGPSNEWGNPDEIGKKRHLMG